MFIQHKKGAPMADHEGTMQPEAVVNFSSELASILSFRKEWYWEVGKYTSKSVANVDTVNAIYRIFPYISRTFLILNVVQKSECG